MTQLATVVGAQGLVGSHLLARLRRLGWQAQASPRHEPGWWRQWPALGTVFYCAGLTADYLARPHDTVSAHVSLLNELLGEARFDALVYLSSARLYDSAHAAPGQAVDEDAPLCLNPAQPRHLFDLSKALGESLCHQASGGRARIARLSCVVAGAGDASGFVGQLLRQVQRQVQKQGHAGRAELAVNTSAHAERDYVHIDDVLDALLHIGVGGTHSTYNVASGRNLGNAALFERLEAISGCRIRPTLAGATGAVHGAVHGAAPGAALAPARLSIARLQDEFNWQPASLLDHLPQLWREAQTCCA